MLTQDQVEKLQLLTKHLCYGQILKDVIEVWKREDVTPIYGSFGISGEKELFEFINPNKKQCCLLGASLINYKVNKSNFWSLVYSSLIEKYSISEPEIDQIWCGFDNSGYYSSEAFDFGNQIRKIVNPVKEIYLYEIKNLECLF